MKIGARDIEEFLPEKLKPVCQIGICAPLRLERKRPIFCHIPTEYGGPRWNAKPSDVWPGVKSIIALIHFTPVALDYSSVENIILQVADILWKRLRIETHVLDKRGRPDRKNLIGGENSFLEATSYDASKKMILFKDIAYHAGLGQYGKNSLIINNRFGSDIKIQVLFTEAKLKYDQPILPKGYPGCKNCNICLKTCPGKIIHNYKVITEIDVCRLSVKTKKPIVIGRLPKRVKIWDSSSTRQKVECRACQSFCPANSQHYKRNGLILARREKGKIALFLAKG